jgi:hypothetical protein
MQTAKRRRASWPIAVSVIAHLAVVVVLALQRPVLVMPVEQGAPPPAIIPILLMPHTPPPTAGNQARPSPIRLHRRPQRFIPPDAPTAPIAPPLLPVPSAAPSRPAPVALHPAPLPEGPKGDVRTALRQGPVGCANQLAVGLNRAERDNCDEKLGKGAKDAPYYEAGLGMSPAKKALLDSAAAAKEADYRYKHAAGTAPLPNMDLKPGATAEDMKRDLGVPHSE